MCLPLVIEVMTQTKINRQYSGILLCETMYDSGWRWVCTSDTLPVMHPAAELSLALLGRRASVGGSVDRADWPCMLGTVDNPPGGVWINFIRCTLEDSQSIVAVTVTRDAIFGIVCGTDWVLPAGYQVLLPEYAECGTMDADGFSIVDNRACVTFGVELYMPWDAPEMVVDLSSTGTVPLQNVADVFGMSGRRDSATESRILQGRDARSI